MDDLKNKNGKTDTYYGQQKDGKRHGQGKITFSDGSKYDGAWNNDIIEGKGTHYFANKAVYEGNFKNNKQNGIGTMTFANKNVYNGAWKDSKMEGQGKMTFANKDVYNGAWKDSKIHGQGKMTFANKDVYNGAWKDSKIHGQGKMTFANKNVYNGACENGVGHGQGVMTFFDLGLYNGAWKNGKRHGQGKMTFFDGNVHNGAWENGQMNGMGTMTNPDGKKYIGEWKDDEIDGLGSTTSDLHHHIGYRQNNILMGPGKITFLDTLNAHGGNVHLYKSLEGNFTNDTALDIATVTFLDGRVYKGAFKTANTVYNGAAQGLGKMTFPDTVNADNRQRIYPYVSYEGGFEGNKMQGRGAAKSSDGSMTVGNFINDKKSGAFTTIDKNGQISFDGPYGAMEGLTTIYSAINHVFFNTFYPYLTKFSNFLGAFNAHNDGVTKDKKITLIEFLPTYFSNKEDEKLLIIDAIEQTKEHFPEIYKHINNTYNANFELSIESSILDTCKKIDFTISNRIDLEPSTTSILKSASRVDNAKVKIKNDRGCI
jgi:hypothetical protein